MAAPATSRERGGGTPRGSTPSRTEQSPVPRRESRFAQSHGRCSASSRAQLSCSGGLLRGSASSSGSSVGPTDTNAARTVECESLCSLHTATAPNSTGSPRPRAAASAASPRPQRPAAQPAEPQPRRSERPEHRNMTPEQVALVKHLTNRMSTTLSALDTVSDAAFVGPPADPRTPHGAFEAVEAPGITLSKYLRGVMASTYRLGVHDAATAGAVAIALIRRLAESGEVPFTPLTAHRLGLTCFIVAQKVHCDTTIANKVAARIGGVELDDLNACERAAIQVLGWKIVVDLSEVHSTMDAICARPNIPLQRTIPY